MKFPLCREMQRRSCREAGKRRLLQQFHPGKSYAPQRFLFTFKNAYWIIRIEEQVSAQASERAVDLFFSHRFIDEIDRCGVAFGCEAGVFFSVDLLEPPVAIIQRMG